jgi:hypothetical protein
MNKFSIIFQQILQIFSKRVDRVVKETGQRIKSSDGKLNFDSLIMQ